MQVIDFEVFKFDWLCVIYDLSKKEVIKIHNDADKLREHYDNNKNEIFIGYNIREYDQYIFKAILLDFNPKEVNDFIIQGKNKGFQFSRLFNRIPLNVFDVMPNPPVSLKTLEGFMGSDIRESSVPWDINRPLTAKELADVFFYCEHDVAQTTAVLSKSIEELTSHIELIKLFDLPKKEFSRTKAQLSARILGAVRTGSREDDFNFTIPNNLKIEKYQFVIDWFKNSIPNAWVELRENVKKTKSLYLSFKETHGEESRKTKEALTKHKKAVKLLNDCEKDYSKFKSYFYHRKLNCKVAGVPHVFAWGGIHGALPVYRDKGYFVNIDVASYYPSMMIEYGYESRNLSDPNKFKEIYVTRMEHKKNKDARANPLKIVLNSTYGAMKDINSSLYDPLQANNVCVTGQLLLLDLLEQLEPHFDIIQSNTDGVLVKLRAENDEEADAAYQLLDDVCYEWEQRTKMVLEFEEFSEVIQRDVNNYIIVDSKGDYKSKGGEVKKQNDLDYDLPIVNKAMVNYFVKGIPVEKTIGDCNDLREFQKIVKVSHLFLYGSHNKKRLPDKTFRVFASKRDQDGKIAKVKKEGGTHEKFANTPEKCFIDNSDVNGKSVPEYLDKNWYIETAKKRIVRFTKKQKKGKTK